MSMFATHREWEEAYNVWAVQVPDVSNMKTFLVFNGSTQPSNFVFEGDIPKFSDVFFQHANWATITVWAADHGYVLVVEGSSTYTDLKMLLDAELEFELDETDWYDADGNCNEGGCYDAGGHYHYLRESDSLDDHMDQLNDR